MRTIIYGCLAAVAAAALFFIPWQGHQEAPNTSSLQPKIEVSPFLHISGITLHEHDKSKHYDINLSAAEGSLDHISNKAVCKNISIQITKDSEHVALLTIKQADVWRHQKIVHCSESVEGTINTLRFKTSCCDYNIASQVITAPQPLTVHIGPCVLTSPQTVIKVAENIIDCNGPVKTVITLPSHRAAGN